MQNADIHVIDLIKNEYFVKWVVAPNEESDHYWSKWIATFPEQKKDVELARQLILSAHYEKDEKMPENDYNLVLGNIVSYSQRRQQKETRANIFLWKLVGVAAMIVMAFFLTIFTKQYIDDQKKRQDLYNSEIIKKTTLPGQKLTIRLPDGSNVILNSESELTYTRSFVSHREVTLRGEAFFEVTKDDEHPFTVRTGAITTTVLGTSFNVRSYPGEIKNSIAVLTGKVQVSDNQGNKAYLIPNVRGVFNLEEKQLLIESFSAEKELGWKDGFLTFENTSLSEVITVLERWYGVKVTVQNKLLLKGEYTGTYKNASLEKVLDGISYTTGIAFSINDNEVTLYKNQAYEK